MKGHHCAGTTCDVCSTIADMQARIRKLEAVAATARAIKPMGNRRQREAFFNLQDALRRLPSGAYDMAGFDNPRCECTMWRR